MNKTEIDIEIVSTCVNIPMKTLLKQWTLAGLDGITGEIALRIVDDAESAALNLQYRNKPGPTNVISFPYDSEENQPLLGDIIFCAPLIEREAQEQKKTFNAHWAHLTIHGVLHLKGYDHIEAKDADIMENKEIAILATLGFPNPYE